MRLSIGHQRHGDAALHRPQTGTTTNSSSQFTHRVGADVKITHFPVLQILRNQANGNETYPNPCSTNRIRAASAVPQRRYATKNYIDTQVLAGAAAGSNSVAGIFLTATGLQAASSTATGVYNSTTYNRVLPSSIATDTPNAGTNSSDVLMSDLTGRLKQAWLDLTAAFTTTGQWIFNGSVT
jgi:hypothetical protein